MQDLPRCYVDRGGELPCCPSQQPHPQTSSDNRRNNVTVEEARTETPTSKSMWQSLTCEMVAAGVPRRIPRYTGGIAAGPLWVLGRRECRRCTPNLVLFERPAWGGGSVGIVWLEKPTSTLYKALGVPGFFIP